MSKVKAAVESVTPEKATLWLKKNEFNRYLQESLVDHYAQQIKDGEWFLNGESIIFSEAGSLLDGQHRLHGIVKAKRAAECIVVRGVDKKAMVSINTGRSRSVADHLKMQGVECTNHLAAAASITYLSKFINGKYIDSKRRVTPQWAFKFLANNKSFLKILGEPQNAKNMRLFSNAIYYAMKYHFSRINSQKTEIFFEGIFSGVGLSETSPILAARRRLEEYGSVRKKGKKDQRAAIYILVTAFTLYIENKRADLSALRYRDGVAIELPKRGGVD